MNMTPPTSIDQAFKCLGKSVCVLTYQHAEQRAASVATAVCNISSDPATLLVCVEKTASFAQLLSPGAAFAINVLNAEQQHIMNNCVREKGEARFNAGLWQSRQNWLLLDDASAHFMCRVSAQHDADSHHIVVATIEDCTANAQAGSIIYHGGTFHALSTA